MVKKTSAQSPAGAIVAMSVAALLFASLGWSAITTLAEANTTGVDPMVVDIGIGLVSLVMGISVMLMFLKYSGMKI